MGIKFLAGMMSLLKSTLEKRKFLSTSMFRWPFLKKFLNVFLGDEMELPYLYLTATNDKEFTGKVLCRKESSKKQLGWSTICHKLESVVKAKIAQNNSQVSEGGITVKPGQDSNHELIIWKVNPFVSSVTCSRYQIAFKWSVNFLTAFFKYMMRWKIFRWMKFLFRHSSNST